MLNGGTSRLDERCLLGAPAPALGSPPAARWLHLCVDAHSALVPPSQRSLWLQVMREASFLYAELVQVRVRGPAGGSVGTA